MKNAGIMTMVVKLVNIAMQVYAKHVCTKTIIIGALEMIMIMGHGLGKMMMVGW